MPAGTKQNLKATAAPRLQLRSRQEAKDSNSCSCLLPASAHALIPLPELAFQICREYLDTLQGCAFTSEGTFPGP